MRLAILAAATTIFMSSSVAAQVPAPASSGPSKAAALSAPDPETEASRKALEGFVGLLAKGDVQGAFEQYTTEDYTQHMKGIAPGRAGALAHIREELNSGGTGSVVALIAQGNLVGIHFRQKFTDGTPPMEVIEIWRVENGRLAEHWGVKQPASAGVR